MLDTMECCRNGEWGYLEQIAMFVGYIGHSDVCMNIAHSDVFRIQYAISRLQCLKLSCVLLMVQCVGPSDR